MWDGLAARLEGQVVILEPLAPRHEDGLYEAAQDMDRSWMFVDAPPSRGAFHRHGCMRVEFKTDAKNERSRRALAALPAQFEAVFRKHMLVGDERDRLRDSAYYAITDDDWPEVKANLLRRLGR